MNIFISSHNTLCTFGAESQTITLKKYNTNDSSKTNLYPAMYNTG